jgi:hypothetical protein
MKYIIKPITGKRDLYVYSIAPDGFINLTDDEFKAKIFTEKELDMDTRVQIRDELKTHYGYMTTVIRVL